MKLIKLHQSIRVLILWIRHKMTDRQFFILSSMVVGLSAGLVAVGLKFIVHQITHFVTNFSETRESFWLYAIVPTLGLSLTAVYIIKFLKGNLNKGSAAIQYA